MGRLASALYRFAAAVEGWGAMAVGSLIWGVLLIPPTLLLAPFWPGARDLFSDATRHALRLYIKSLLFMRLEVEHRERRLEGPRILVANHQSFLDSIVMIGLEPRLGGPVRSYMLRLPVLGSIIRLSGFYRSDIGELLSLERMRQGAEMAKARGGGLLFFPEGTRTRTGEIGPFHRGAFRAAFDHELPIQPVVIEGLDKALPAGSFLARTHTRYPVRVRYLEPIHPPFGSGIRRDVVRALAERVRGLLAGELARMRDERGDESRDEVRGLESA